MMEVQNGFPWIIPAWSAPRNVKALSTVRQGGVSPPPFDTFNFGQNVGDPHVIQNRQLLREFVGLPSEPVWLTQVHGVQVIHLEASASEAIPVLPEADAAICGVSGPVCAVTTADCLPILMCDRKGSCIAAVHAGWRGLSTGIIEATIDALASTLACHPTTLIAWLGPAIGPTAFEVGQDVKTAFLKSSDEAAFLKKSNGKWMADLYQLARVRLREAKIAEISGGQYCTFSDETRFYSFRRSNPHPTGRMATLIWLEN